MTDSLEEFWQSAYQKYGSAILAYLRLRCPSLADAEDLLQETFVKAIRSSARLAHPERVRSYLFTIAHHLMVNRLRDRKPTVAIADDSGSDQGAQELLAAPQTSPDFVHHMNAFRNKLNLVMRDMPPHLFKAFDLGVLQREPYAEIARKTGWSLANVKINVYRARKRAIKELSEFLL